MRIKKALATFVAGTFLFSSVATAGAAQFSDIAGSDSASAIQKLNALGIINGYEDGTFRPDGEITRAEFAKIAVIAAGLEDSADLLKDTASQYSDVKASAWYTGWINIATSQGYLKGYPDGSFKPNANISYAESITILMRILGYDDRLPGNWPVDYIAKAASEDVTKGVKVTASAKATRGDVAMLASNSLDTTVVTWNNDTEEFEMKLDTTQDPAVEVSLLDDSFDSAMVEDAVAISWELDDEEYSLKLDGQTIKFAETFALAGVASVPAIDVSLVDYITNDDDEIIYVEVKDYGVIKGDEITVITGDKTVKVDDGKEYEYLKGHKTKADTKWVGLVQEPEYLDEADYDLVKVVLDDDEDVAIVKTVNFDAPAIVDKVKNDEITFKYNPESITEPNDLDDSDTNYLVLKDGKVASLSDVEENDVVYVDYSSNGTLNGGLDYVIRAYSKSVSGTIEDIDGTKVKIDGKWYEVATTTPGGTSLEARMSTDGGDEFEEVSYDDLEDIEIRAVFNRYGDIQLFIANESAESTDIYGVVTNFNDDYTNESGEVTDYVKVLKEDGTEVNYKADEDDVLALVQGNFIKFSLTSDGEIDASKVELQNPAADLTDDIKSGDFDDADKDNNRVQVDGSWLVLADDVVIFNTNPADTDKDAEVVSKADFLEFVEDTASKDDVNLTYVMDGAKVAYVVMNQPVTVTEDVAPVVRTGYTPGKGYYAVIIRDGAEVKVYSNESYYDVDGNGSKDAGELDIDDIIQNLGEGSVVTFSLTDGEFSAIDEAVDEDVYGTQPVETTGITNGVLAKITDEVGSDNFEVTTVVAGEANGTAKSFLVTEDTVLIDVTGDSTVKTSTEFLSEGSYVVYKADATSGEFEWIVKVPRNK